MAKEFYISASSNNYFEVFFWVVWGKILKYWIDKIKQNNFEKNNYEV